MSWETVMSTAGYFEVRQTQDRWWSVKKKISHKTHFLIGTAQRDLGLGFIGNQVAGAGRADGAGDALHRLHFVLEPLVAPQSGLFVRRVGRDANAGRQGHLERFWIRQSLPQFFRNEGHEGSQQPEAVVQAGEQDRARRVRSRCRRFTRLEHGFDWLQVDVAQVIEPEVIGSRGRRRQLVLSKSGVTGSDGHSQPTQDPLIHQAELNLTTMKSIHQYKSNDDWRHAESATLKPMP